MRNITQREYRKMDDVKIYGNPSDENIPTKVISIIFINIGIVGYYLCSRILG